MLVLCGEWIAEDAWATKWQRLGWGMAVLGAVWHLVLDGACLTLPRSSTFEWKASVAGAAVGALIMALVLRRAWRGLRDPDAPEPDPAAVAPDESSLGRLARELALFGGTALAVLLISLGFVALAVMGIIQHPERSGPLIGGAGFFALCAAAAVGMGVERRALYLGQPSPLARLRPRFLRRVTVLITREGLTQLDRNGATVYPWPTIAAVSVGELYNNAAIMINLFDGAPALRVPAEGRPLPDDEKWTRREARNRRIQRALTGSDLAILGVLTEEGPGVLAKQLKEALTDEAVRARLPTLAEVMEQKGRRT